MMAASPTSSASSRMAASPARRTPPAPLASSPASPRASGFSSLSVRPTLSSPSLLNSPWPRDDSNDHPVSLPSFDDLTSKLRHTTATLLRWRLFFSSNSYCLEAPETPSSIIFPWASPVPLPWTPVSITCKEQMRLCKHCLMVVSLLLFVAFNLYGLN